VDESRAELRPESMLGWKSMKRKRKKKE